MKNKKKVSALMILSLAILTSLNLTLASDKEASFKVQKGDVLNVEIKQGNINVSTWDKNEVKISAKNIDDDELSLYTAEQ